MIVDSRRGIAAPNHEQPGANGENGGNLSAPKHQLLDAKSANGASL
jgi:hypothetical protein